MLITHKIQMDIQRFGIMPYLDVVCGDAYTRKLGLTLFSGGAEWLVPAGVSAVVRYSRSDGHGGLYDTLPDGKAACTVKDNVVTAILAPQVLSAPGFAKVSVALVKDEQILGLFPVGINVKADPSQNVIPAENYYNYPTIGDINKAIADLESRMEELERGGSGITNEEKKVILALFKNIAYTADMSAKVAELEALWSVSYKVTYKLSGAASSNDAARVAEGSKYTTILTAEGGYTLSGAEVSVTMGGADITSIAYSNGVITIESVTGPVVISAVANEVPSYSVTNNLTGVTTDSTVTKVSEGGSYRATLTVDDGYVLSRLVITMGGVDITADVYGEGYILIAEVTGDVVITAVAEEPAMVETFKVGGTNITFYAEDGSTLASKNYANAYMSKRSVETDSVVNIVYTNNGESAVSADILIGAIPRNTAYAFASAKVKLYHSKKFASGVSITAGNSFTAQYTVPAGYHVGVGMVDGLDCVISGALNVYEPVNEFNFIDATPKSNWFLYSGNEVSEDALVTSTVQPKYMTENAFAEDTTVRIVVLNTSDASVSITTKEFTNYSALFYTVGNGVNAIGYQTDFSKVAFSHSLGAGIECRDVEIAIPAGHYLATSAPLEIFFVKKVS